MAESEWAVVDSDGAVGLLSGLDLLLIQALLFGDDPGQGVGHCLELLLVCYVLVVHGLGQEVLDSIVVVSLLGDGLMYGSNDLT